MKKMWLLIIVALVLLVSVKIFNQESKIEIQIDETAFKVWVADTPAERNKGLSGKTNLKEDEGMLFIFDKVGEYGFWMKGMNFPIDIVWINGERRIVEVAESVEPSSYPKVFTSKEPVLYVLELPAGHVSLYHIDIGSEMFFDR